MNFLLFLLLYFSSPLSEAMEDKTMPDLPIDPSSLLACFEKKPLRLEEVHVSIRKAEKIINKNADVLVLPRTPRLKELIEETMNPHFYENSFWVQQQFNKPNNSIEMTPLGLFMAIEWGIDNYIRYIKENDFPPGVCKDINQSLRRLSPLLFLKIYGESTPKKSIQ